MYIIKKFCKQCKEPIYTNITSKKEKYSCNCFILSDPSNGISVNDVKIIPGIVLAKGNNNEELQRRSLSERISE